MFNLHEHSRRSIPLLFPLLHTVVFDETEKLSTHVSAATATSQSLSEVLTRPIHQCILHLTFDYELASAS